MKKILIALSLFISSMVGMFLTPLNMVYAYNGNSDIAIQTNLADGELNLFPDFIEISDFKYNYIHTSAEGGPIVSKHVYGNVLYLFNTPFDIPEDYAIFEVELSYETCSKWFMGIQGFWCTTKKEEVGATVYYDRDVIYYTEENYQTLFDYASHPIEQIGATSELIAMSDELGSLAITTDLNSGYATNYYFAYRSTTVGTSTLSNYNDLTKYEHYFILPDAYTWDNVIIRMKVGNLTTGEYEEIICGEDGKGCYLGGAPIPETTPPILTKLEQIIDKINELFANDMISYIFWGILAIAGLSLLNHVFGVLKFMSAVPGTIGKILKFLALAIKWLFVTLKKIIIFKLKAIRWIVVKLWWLLGWIIKIIIMIYSKITELFMKKRGKGEIFKGG